MFRGDLATRFACSWTPKAYQAREILHKQSHVLEFFTSSFVPILERKKGEGTKKEKQVRKELSKKQEGKGSSEQGLRNVVTSSVPNGPSRSSFQS